jgi:site-specific recombinase XerD
MIQLVMLGIVCRTCDPDNMVSAEKVHAHMLRHSTGYKLAHDGADTRSIQSYLGHRDIRHTVRYTELSAKPFRDFFRD